MRLYIPFFDSFLPRFFGGRLNKTQTNRTRASRAVRAVKTQNHCSPREKVLRPKACSSWRRPCTARREKTRPEGPARWKSTVFYHWPVESGHWSIVFLHCPVESGRKEYVRILIILYSLDCTGQCENTMESIWHVSSGILTTCLSGNTFADT